MNQSVFPFGTTFKGRDANGFQLPLPNGLKISVQWGAGSYSDNYDADFGATPLYADVVEVGVVVPGKGLLQTPFSNGDTVHAYCTLKDLWKIITWAKKQKT